MSSQHARFTVAACGAALLIALAGCETQKSSTPLSPSVAGPIPGVNISAPSGLDPSNVKFKDTEQPIRLTVQNAATTGVRPLSYTFEVATNTGFSSKVFSRSGVAPGSNGKTSVQIDPLGIGQVYYWRVRAEDGANTGPYSTASFEIYPKPSVSPPVAISPINGEQLATATAALTVQNAAWAGPVGGLSYEFQVAADQAFTQLLTGGVTPEGGGTTTFTTAPLAAGKAMYWRARASDGTTTGGWSATQAFKTPAATGGGGGGGGGGGTSGNCDSLINGDRQKLVECIWATVPRPTDEVMAFEVTKRVAWALRGERAGLLIKNGGENIVSWQGYSFSASRICYPDGHIYKVISDAGPGGANGPTWSDNGFVDSSLYVPAIDPSKR